MHNKDRYSENTKGFAIPKIRFPILNFSETKIGFTIPNKERKG